MQAGGLPMPGAGYYRQQVGRWSRLPAEISGEAVLEPLIERADEVIK
jgi:hypothetical protein